MQPAQARSAHTRPARTDASVRASRGTMPCVCAQRANAPCRPSAPASKIVCAIWRGKRKAQTTRGSAAPAADALPCGVHTVNAQRPQPQRPATAFWLEVSATWVCVARWRALALPEQSLARGFGGCPERYDRHPILGRTGEPSMPYQKSSNANVAEAVHEVRTQSLRLLLSPDSHPAAHM